MRYKKELKYVVTNSELGKFEVNTRKWEMGNVAKFEEDMQWL